MARSADSSREAEGALNCQGTAAGRSRCTGSPASPVFRLERSTHIPASRFRVSRHVWQSRSWEWQGCKQMSQTFMSKGSPNAGIKNGMRTTDCRR